MIIGQVGVKHSAWAESESTEPPWPKIKRAPTLISDIAAADALERRSCLALFGGQMISGPPEVRIPTASVPPAD